MGLVDNLVCGELSLELCGYAMGLKSETTAHSSLATKRYCRIPVID